MVMVAVSMITVTVTSIYLHKFGFDTAENWPSGVWGMEVVLEYS